MRLLHIEFVGMKSPKELFLQSYVERVSHSGMGSCHQGYRDGRRNRRTPYILGSRTCNKDDQRFQCHFQVGLSRVMFPVCILNTQAFR